MSNRATEDGTTTSADASLFPGADVTPRMAATVMLVRDRPTGLEVWMIERSASMSFAPKALAFPGGRVDPSDYDDSTPWRGSSPESFAARLGMRVDEARAVAVAAVREVFEETELLLVTPLPDLDVSAERCRVELRQTTLCELLSGSDAHLDVARLHPWGRWVTPPTRVQRYDTCFFVGVTPDGRSLRMASSEGVCGAWTTPQAALEQQQSGQAVVLPPTRAMLEDLGRITTTDELLAAAARQDLTPVHPEVRRLPDGSLEIAVPDRTYRL